MSLFSSLLPFAGNILGGILGGKGSKENASQSTTVIPWEGIQPALRELYGSALSNFQGPDAQYYPRSTVTTQSPVTEHGLRGMFDRATRGSPLTGQAQDEASRTLRGDYFFNPATAGMYGMANRDFMSTAPGMDALSSIGYGGMMGGNPYVDSMFNQAAGQVGRQFSRNVMPGVASMFSGAGRFGSNQMAEGLGQAQQEYGNTLNRLATDIYGQNYNTERSLMQQALNQMGQFGLTGRGLQQQAFSDLGTQFGRERAMQMQALGGSPGLSQADYYDLDRLMGVGQNLDDYNQRMLDADISRWNFNQNIPEGELSFLNSILQGGTGLSGRNTTTSGQSGGGFPGFLTGMLGGGQIGSALAGMFSGGAGGMNPAQGLSLGSGLGLNTPSGWGGSLGSSLDALGLF